MLIGRMSNARKTKNARRTTEYLRAAVRFTAGFKEALLATGATDLAKRPNIAKYGVVARTLQFGMKKKLSEHNRTFGSITPHVQLEEICMT